MHMPQCIDIDKINLLQMHKIHPMSLYQKAKGHDVNIDVINKLWNVV